MSRGLLKPEDEEPDIQYFAWYVEAFRELSTTRQVGFGSGPIPFTAIAEYSRLYDVEDFEEFLYLIRVMDYKFLELEAKKQKAQTRDNGRKAKRN